MSEKTLLQWRAFLRGIGMSEEDTERISEENLLEQAYFYPLNEVFPSMEELKAELEKAKTELKQEAILSKNC